MPSKKVYNKIAKKHLDWSKIKSKFYTTIDMELKEGVWKIKKQKEVILNE